METSNINLANEDYPQYSLARHDMETENIKIIKNINGINSQQRLACLQETTNEYSLLGVKEMTYK